MKNILMFCFLFGLFAALSAEEPLPETSDNVLLNRLQINQMVLVGLENEDADNMTMVGGGQKSIGRAVLFSAILPGSGQLYANSYLKAAFFLAVEGAAITLNRVYDKKGDEKDAEFKVYAAENWSEQRYWSYVYDQLNGQTDVAPNFPHGQFDGDIQLDNAGRPVIQNWEAAEEILKEFATTSYLDGFSHTLPETQTQQYYEMIGKYPHQFGNAWSDANFNEHYQDFGLGNITEMNAVYATMRDDANKFYDKAAYGSMIMLLNHLFSAIDAGFTTRSYNKRQMRLTFQQRELYDSHVNMYGLTMSF